MNPPILRVLIGSLFFAGASWLCLPGARGQAASSPTAPSDGGSTLPVPAAVAAAPPEPTLGSALVHFRTGQFDAAISDYNALLNQPGIDPAICYAALSQVYLKQHKVDDAFDAASKALKLAPSYPATQTAMGDVLFRQGKIADAEKIYISLIRANTSYARAYYGESLISWVSMYRKQGKQMIDRAYELDPDDPDIWEFYLQTLSGDERVTALQKYLASKTNDDARERDGLQHELVLLQDDLAHPAHTCRLSSSVTSMESNLSLLLYDATHMRGVALPVRLNNTTATLQFDTGASGILVDRKVAEKAGVRKIVDVKIGGIGDKGDADAYIGHVDTIRIGGLEFNDCDVQVIDQNSVVDTQGLIGADVFHDFLVELDMPNRKFRLSQLPPYPDGTAPSPVSLESRSSRGSQRVLHNRYIPPEMKSYTAVYRFGHDLVIPTLLNDSRLKLFIIDTGAFGNSISPAAAREVSKLSPDADTKIKGISGNVKDVYRVDKVRLTFAHLSQRNEDLVSFDTAHISDDVGVEISGFLGFSTLAMLDMKFDYRDGLVKFDFNPNIYCRMNCN